MIAQEQPEAQANSSEPQQDSRYPWQLKCCNQMGETRLYHMPKENAEALFFAGESPPPLVNSQQCHI